MLKLSCHIKIIFFFCEKSLNKKCVVLLYAMIILSETFCFPYIFIVIIQKLPKYLHFFDKIRIYFKLGKIIKNIKGECEILSNFEQNIN